MGSGGTNVAGALQLSQVVRERTVGDAQGAKELAVMDARTPAHLVKNPPPKPIFQEPFLLDSAGNQQEWHGEPQDPSPQRAKCRKNGILSGRAIVLLGGIRFCGCGINRGGEQVGRVVRSGLRSCWESILLGDRNASGVRGADRDWALTSAYVHERQWG